MQSTLRIVTLILSLACAGCFSNSWHTESFFDQLTYPAADEAAAVADQKRILAFIPTLGFKRTDQSTGGTPATEAIFIRNDNDHFHITVTVRTLVRIDQPGLVTTVRVQSYNVGEEGAVMAGKSTMNEIDQLYRKNGPRF